jgi:hypothetical protein
VHDWGIGSPNATTQCAGSSIVFGYAEGQIDEAQQGWAWIASTQSWFDEHAATHVGVSEPTGNVTLPGPQSFVGLHVPSAQYARAGAVQPTAEHAPEHGSRQLSGGGPSCGPTTHGSSATCFFANAVGHDPQQPPTAVAMTQSSSVTQVSGSEASTTGTALVVDVPHAATRTTTTAPSFEHAMPRRSAPDVPERPGQKYVDGMCRPVCHHAARAVDGSVFSACPQIA